MAKKAPLRDIIPGRVVVNDPNALTVQEWAKEKGYSNSHMAKILMNLVGEGKAERVLVKRKGKTVPAFR
mgnify:FL=1